MKQGCAIILVTPLLLAFALIATVMITNGGIFGWILVILGAGVGVLLGFGAMSEETGGE
jgi:amino acid transporter